MAIDLIGCDRPLKVMIETELQDWSFIYYIVDSVDIQMANTPHQHNISYNTTITDHVVREQDTLDISGSISCIQGCGDTRETQYFNIVISELKRLKESMLYERKYYATLTSNDWQFKYAILTNVSVRESQDSPQRKEIRTSWRGSNFAGLVQQPDFVRGGIVHSGNIFPNP